MPLYGNEGDDYSGYRVPPTEPAEPDPHTPLPEFCIARTILGFTYFGNLEPLKALVRVNIGPAFSRSTSHELAQINMVAPNLYEALAEDLGSAGNVQFTTLAQEEIRELVAHLSEVFMVPEELRSRVRPLHRLLGNDLPYYDETLYVVDYKPLWYLELSKHAENMISRSLVDLDQEALVGNLLRMPGVVFWKMRLGAKFAREIGEKLMDFLGPPYKPFEEYDIAEQLNTFMSLKRKTPGEFDMAIYWLYIYPRLNPLVYHKDTQFRQVMRLLRKNRVTIKGLDPSEESYEKEAETLLDRFYVPED